jgi:hypothetical protein
MFWRITSEIYKLDHLNLLSEKGNLKLPMQSVPITIDVSSNLDKGEVYNIVWFFPGSSSFLHQ